MTDPNYRDCLREGYGCSDREVERFTAYIDDSAYDLEDWMLALSHLQDWLKSQSLKLSFEDTIDYIHCAAKACPNQNKLDTLQSITNEFLNTYGCDRAIKIQ